MASLTEIRRALAARLDNLDGQVTVRPGPTEYGRVKGFEAQRFTLRIVVTDDDGTLLDELLEPAGERSVRERLTADYTLGGLVADVRIISSSGHQLYQHQDGPRLGAEWTVEVLT